MVRKSERHELGDVAVTCRQLPYQKAEDILPDVLKVVATMIQAGISEGVLAKLKDIKAREDVVKLLPVLVPLMRTLGDQLGDGKLKQLAPLVLASTTVEMVHPEKGERETFELHKSADRAAVFDEHPDLYLVTLFLAGRVTFSRFFSVRDLLARLKSTP